MENDKVKSVFRRREVEKLYVVTHRRLEYEGYVNNNYEYRAYVTANYDNVISDKQIGKYEIEIPKLEVGQEFFLHDIEEIVVIEKAMRSTDGSVTYYVKDKLVETENTYKSKIECEEAVRNWRHDEKEMKATEKKYFELKDEFNGYKITHPYKHRWFNFKIGE